MNRKTGQNDRISQAARLLKLLSVETRLRILELLRERDLCVGALTCRLGLTQGAVSQHLKILRDAGLVTARRKGTHVHYRVNDNRLREWRRQIDGLLGGLGLGLDAERGRQADGGQHDRGEHRQRP